MGIYYSVYENPCPRCGGRVSGTFISVSPMSYSMFCGGCKARDYTDDEKEALGGSLPLYFDAEGNEFIGKKGGW